MTLLSPDEIEKEITTYLSGIDLEPTDINEFKYKMKFEFEIKDEEIDEEIEVENEEEEEEPEARKIEIIMKIFKVENKD